MKMKRIQISIFLLILIFSSTSSFHAIIEPTSADLHGILILYVGGSGPGNYTKIQDAIDDSDSGDTVFVYDDSSPYYENLRISKSINLVGEDRNTTIINGNAIDDVVRVVADFVSICCFTIGNGHDGIRVYSSNNTISGNIIRYNIENGLHMYYSKGNNIENNIVSNNKNGLYVDKSSSNIILDNVISRNYFNGIYLSRTSKNKITGNAIFDNVGLDNLNNLRAGIYCIESDGNTINGNKISHNHGSGLFLIWSDFNNVTGNNISFNFEDVWYDDSYGIAVSGYGNVIKNNHILNNSDSGIQLYGSNGNNIVMNNNISFNNPGINLDTPNNIISFNEIFSNNNLGIDIDSSNNSIVENNFLNNGISISDTSGQNNLSNNKIDGKPLLYLEGQCNKTIDVKAGQIILIKCTNITIKNQVISNVITGIDLVNTNKCCIIGNNFNSTYCGISLRESSDNNTILYNNFYSIKWDCVSLYSSIYNTVLENNFSIGWTAVDLINSSYNNIKDNNINLIEYGITLLYFSIYNCLTNNILSNNSCGIFIYDSHFNTITKNQVFDSNEEGIVLSGSGRNNIINNKLSNNKRGIHLYSSNHNNILENNFIDNRRNALFENCKNYWKNNFWNRPRIFPKIIFGKDIINNKEIRWFNIDWHPMQEPNDI